MKNVTLFEIHIYRTVSLSNFFTCRCKKIIIYLSSQRQTVSIVQGHHLTFSHPSSLDLTLALIKLIFTYLYS